MQETRSGILASEVTSVSFLLSAALTRRACVCAYTSSVFVVVVAAAAAAVK